MTLTPDDWEVIRLSLRVALVGVTATLPIAFALAYLIAAVSRASAASCSWTSRSAGSGAAAILAAIAPCVDEAGTTVPRAARK